MCFFDSDGKVVYPAFGWVAAIDEEVALGFVVDNGHGVGVVVGGVPDLVAVDVKIVVEEQAYLPIPSFKISDDDFLYKYV